MPDLAAPPAPPQVIIAGYGLPGRLVADLLATRQIPYSVIEANADVASRLTGVRIITGDVRDQAVLHKAGIESASLLLLTIPDEEAIRQAIPIARRLNPALKIVARCLYTSAGLRAKNAGADHVIIAEQVVAQEFQRLTGELLA